MKTEISRDSHQPQKCYSGVYQQQGRMLTDADWNELVEILKERLNDAIKDVVGNKAGSMGGTPRHRALKIIKASDSDSLTIQPGHVYVDGVIAQVPSDADDADIAYDAQPDFPSPPGLPGASSLANNYLIYADVWERTVTHLMDERLRDKGLHGADTCTRKQTMAQVKWSPKTVDPEQSAKNPAKGNAELTVTLLQKTTQPDPCDPCAAQLDVESKTGNYLFRVEVHDVKGDADNPDEITLKWSSENAAEQHALKNATGDDVDPPAEFKSGQWAYEFFDETSERHLGIHLAPGFTPSRGELTEVYPGTVPTRSFVRRWDGFCRLAKNVGSWEVAEEFDRSQSGPGSVSFAEIADGKLTVNLDAQTLTLTLNSSFVAGDYWLAEVREAEHKAGSVLIENKTPQGIEHHYLTLGTVKDGVLQPNPEGDRKYAFPPLTEMTRMFMAGGDGQEAMPGHDLPYPIQVGVANGEWPVSGARVRFELVEGEGSLSKPDSVDLESYEVVVADTHVIVTSADGRADCSWTLGASGSQRVKATLLDPDDSTGATELDHPPLYFNANLSTADQVAYTSDCEANAPNTVHKLLVEDSLTPPDQLILGTDGYYTVKEVLDALLCRLKAKHIPYNPNESSATTSRWRDIKELSGTGDLSEPNTVQEAIDDLIKWLESSDIIYGFQDNCADTAYGVKSLNSYVREDLGKTALNSTTKIKDLWDKLLCLLDANRIPYDPTLKEARWRDIKELSHLGMMWSVQEETPGVPKCSRLVRDLDGNVIATASSFSSSFSKLRTSGKFYSQILKLDDKGHILWSKFIDVLIGGLGIQQDGTIVIAGSFSDEVDLGGSAGVLTPEGGFDLFVAKLNSNGDVFWKDQYGSTESEILTGLAIDSNDAIYLTGHFEETINFGGSDLVPGADKDIFIVKLNSDGSHEWSYRYATSGEVEDAQILVDQNDNILVTGYFSGSLDFGGDPLESSSPTTQSVFFAKLNTNGVHQWSYKYGGTQDCKGHAIALDNDNNILLCGSYKGTMNFGGDNLPTVGAVGDEHEAAFNEAAYVAKFSDNGSDISELWSKAFVGTFISVAFCIAADADNNIVFGGSFIGSINFGGGEITSEDLDGFLTRIDADGNFIWANRFSVRNYLDYPFAIVLDNDGYPTFAWQLWSFYGNMTLNKVSKLNWEMRIAPATVQEALDDLIENLESSDINYRLPVCAGTKDSVRKRLHSISWVPDNTALKIKELFDALLCELDASTIPYDRNTNDGSLRDGFVDKSGDTMTGDLSVNGTVKATAFDVNGDIRVRGGDIDVNGDIRVRGGDIKDAGGTARISLPDNGNLELKEDNGITALAISNDRRVGIGTTEKLSKLTVRGHYGWKLGTVAVTNGSRSVVGTGTSFLSEVGIGDRIFVGDGGGAPSGGYRIVTEITSNTNLTVDANFTITLSGVRWWAQSSLFRAEYYTGDARFIISHEGKVGIRTTSPSYDLHTNGTSYAKTREGGGIDYAEYFESLNLKKIPTGTSVVLEKGKVRNAKKGEVPIGVISANPIIVGGVHTEWPKKYLRDEFGKLIMEKHQEEIMAPKKEKVKKERQKVEKKTIEEEVTRTEIVFEKKKYCQKESTETVTRETEEPVFKEVDLYDVEGKNKIGRHKIPVMETYEEEIEVLDEDGQPVLVGTGGFVTEQRPKLNPDYDESREYVPREKRPEWNCVGLLGQLHLRKGQPVAPTWLKIKDISDEVELWLVK